MSEYSSKLAALAYKKKKLQEEETRLIQKRKDEIATLAEQFDLLSAPNELIAGIFVHAKQSLETNDPRVKEWTHAGKNILTQKKNRNSKETKSDPIPAS